MTKELSVRQMTNLSETLSKLWELIASDIDSKYTFKSSVWKPSDYATVHEGETMAQVSHVQGYVDRWLEKNS